MIILIETPIYESTLDPETGDVRIRVTHNRGVTFAVVDVRSDSKVIGTDEDKRQIFAEVYDCAYEDVSNAVDEQYTYDDFLRAQAKNDIDVYQSCQDALTQERELDEHLKANCN